MKTVMQVGQRRSNTCTKTSEQACFSHWQHGHVNDGIVSGLRALGGVLASVVGAVARSVSLDGVQCRERVCKTSARLLWMVLL